MSITTRTALATLIRNRNLGLLSDTEFYHAVCSLIGG